MRRLNLAGVFVVFCVTATAAAPVLNPALSVVMPAKHARDLLRQCSREVPHSVEATWTPDVSQIVRLEKAFPDAFKKAVMSQRAEYRKNLVDQMDKYARQYGGIVTGGRKVIYVNGFLAHMIDFDGTDLANQKWRRQANIVCDGGPSFFGAAFDPETNNFTHFAFNGVA